MRMLSALLLTVLCAAGAWGLDLSAADLQAIADKNKTMRVGEAASVKVVIGGKTVFVGLVKGASGLTVAGEGLPNALLLGISETQNGVLIEVKQGGAAGAAPAVLVAGGTVTKLDAASLAQARGTPPSGQPQVATQAQQEQQRKDAVRATNLAGDLNSLAVRFDYFSSPGSQGSTIPDWAVGVIAQNNSNTTSIINNPGGYPPGSP